MSVKVRDHYLSGFTLSLWVVFLDVLPRLVALVAASAGIVCEETSQQVLWLFIFALLPFILATVFLLGVFVFAIAKGIFRLDDIVCVALAILNIILVSVAWTTYGCTIFYSRVGREATPCQHALLVVGTVLVTLDLLTWLLRWLMTTIKLTWRVQGVDTMDITYTWLPIRQEPPVVGLSNTEELATLGLIQTLRFLLTSRASSPTNIP